MLNTRWSCIGVMSEFSMKINDSRRVRTLPVHLETVYFVISTSINTPKRQVVSKKGMLLGIYCVVNRCFLHSKKQPFAESDAVFYRVILNIRTAFMQ